MSSSSNHLLNRTASYIMTGTMAVNKQMKGTMAKRHASRHKSLHHEVWRSCCIGQSPGFGCHDDCIEKPRPAAHHGSGRGFFSADPVRFVLYFFLVLR
ncbi:hypothetical protein [Paenibacillus spongiae]|uniref:Uncharacterized protein n=1 Tax=Paenibacillus spongiae TaxID=2909671 RepID=A0ABY5S7P3_9BACL|nr:hypothetical protein [Paenibacillus spongiae]UVI28348.1 hypothetical protein L1F29_23240 [Paenibacillus spongiae]